MIISYSINNTNQHQHKLHNSKIIARNCALSTQNTEHT